MHCRVSVVVIIGGEKDVRTMLLTAFSLNMTSGAYAFIYPELIEKEAIGNTSWAGGSGKMSITNVYVHRFYFPLCRIGGC